MGIVNVSNIQSFSLDDGDGIRTTIFLKGCNLHCPWCSNPECMDIVNQYWFDEEKCVGKNKEACFYHTSCTKDKASLLRGKLIKGKQLSCPFHALSAVSCQMTCEDLEKEILRQNIFWREEGGVTFSGGEPLLQIDEYEDLLIALKKKKVNLCVETALFVSQEKVMKALKYFDFFFIDMKILDSEECRRIIGGDIECYINNLKAVDALRTRYVIRIPFIEPFIANEKNLHEIKKHLKQYKPERIEVLRGHTLGKKKYQMLNKSMEEYTCSEKNAKYFWWMLKQDFEKVFIL